MTDSANNSDKEKLELEQLHLNNEKLKVELNKLRQDTKPDARWFRLLKNVGALGAAATVIATLYGIYDSYNKTIEDRRQSRISEQRSQISEAINKLQSPNTISKLIGVSILSGYLGSNDQTQKSSGVVTALLDVFELNANLGATGSDVRRQILFTLASLVATEKDLQILAAVADLIVSIPKDGPITPGEWSYFQKLLVQQSRALMAKGDLLSKRQLASSLEPSDEEVAAQNIAVLIAMNVRKGVVSNFREYAGIYCSGCDFHGAAFPDNTNFAQAVLDFADFQGSTLRSAVFDGAEIERVDFTEADLRKARFGITPDNNPAALTSYIYHAVSSLERKARVNLLMPVFSCANLEDVNFDHQALFPGVLSTRRTYVEAQQKPTWYEDLMQTDKETAQKGGAFVPLFVLPPRFYKANLTNAHLEDVRFFSFTPATPSAGLHAGDLTSIQLTSDMHKDPYGRVFAEFTFREGRMLDKAFDPDEAIGNFAVAEFQDNLVRAFVWADTANAFLPPNVAVFLKNSKEKLEMISKDIDVTCVPRRD